jgi:hypothetical protein
LFISIHSQSSEVSRAAIQIIEAGVQLWSPDELKALLPPDHHDHIGLLRGKSNVNLTKATHATRHFTAKRLARSDLRLHRPFHTPPNFSLASQGKMTCLDLHHQEASNRGCIT